MHSWLEYGIGDVMSFLGCHIWMSFCPSWTMFILVTWLRYCPVSPPCSYFISSLQLISSPWGHTLNMQIFRTSLKFPLRFDIHWCLLPDAALTRMLAECWLSNISTLSMFKSQPSASHYKQDSSFLHIYLFIYLFLAWTRGFQFFSGSYFITVFN